MRPILMRIVSTVLTAALLVPGCSPVDDACPPVDPGGECFVPSHRAFLEHAVESARAWPQLAGRDIEADEVIEAVDTVDGHATWLVPLRSDGWIVAASRFLPFRNEAKLAEVVLYEPPRRTFPSPDDGEELRLVSARCGDPLPRTCLFRNYAWRLEPVP